MHASMRSASASASKALLRWRTCKNISCVGDQGAAALPWVLRQTNQQTRFPELSNDLCETSTTRTRCCRLFSTSTVESSSFIDEEEEAIGASTPTAWTLDREKRLRSILNGKADLSSDLDLSKEILLAASWQATHGKVNDLNRLIKRTEKYVDRLQGTGDNTEHISTSIPYESAIRSLLQASADRPEYLLDASKHMHSLLGRLSDRTRPVLFPTVNNLLGHVVTAWARCRINSVGRGSKDSQSPAHAAEEWLRRWVEIVLKRNDPLCDDNIDTNTFDDDKKALGPGSLVFGIVIDAHAKSRTVGSATRAEAVLQWLLDIRKELSEGPTSTAYLPPRPNTVMFTSVIDAWSRAAHFDAEAVENAEKWLEIMEENYFELGHQEAKPSILPYSAVVMAHSRSRVRKTAMSGDRIGHTSAEKAENILLRLLRRNEQFIDCDDETNTQANSLVEIDVNIVNGIIDAWARQVGKGSPEDAYSSALRAERWLALLLQNANGGEEWQSNDCRTVATAAIHDSHPLSESGREILPMVAASKILPDVVTFNTTISAFSRVRNSLEAADRADRCFQAMREQRIDPTGISFGSIIQAWGNVHSSKGAIQATKYLDEYEQLGRDGKIEPNVIVYNNALNAWSCSGRNDVLPKMRIILDRLEKFWSDPGSPSAALVPPDIVSYHTFLRACTARSKSDPDEAFRFFLSAFDKLTGQDDRVVPEMSTFVSTLVCADRCVSSSMDRLDRRYFDLCRTIFERCCDHGLVGKAVIGTLRCALPPDSDAFANILGIAVSDMSADRPVSSIPTPPKWRRNLTRKDREGKGRSHGSATTVGSKHSKEMRLSSRKYLRR